VVEAQGKYRAADLRDGEPHRAKDMTSPGESTSRLSDGQLLDWFEFCHYHHENQYIVMNFAGRREALLGPGVAAGVTIGGKLLPRAAALCRRPAYNRRPPPRDPKASPGRR
jgi:hypothetical protein